MYISAKLEKMIIHDHQDKNTNKIVRHEENNNNNDTNKSSPNGGAGKTPHH